MKFSTYIRAASLALLGLTGVNAAPALEKRDPYTPQPAGRLFKIDQKTQYFSGINIWYLAYSSDSEMESILKQVSKSGLKTARIWAFGNTNNPSTTSTVYFQTLNSTGAYINMNKKNGIPRLDKAVQLAEKYKITLIMPLLNNWDDLGGINVYQNAFGGSHQDFYTNPRAQQAYRDYVKFIVTRYKHSCAIFAFELCNECRCQQCNTDIIYNWAKEISGLIKSLDSHHQVSLGDEGWAPSANPNAGTSYAYSSYEGVDFAKNLAISTIDFGTVHAYPSSWGVEASNYASWGVQWFKDHDNIGKALGKPVIIEEYGVQLSNWADASAIMKQWQQTILKETSIASDMVWQFGTKQLTSIQPYGSDPYVIYYDEDPASAYQTLIVAQAKSMAAKPPKTIT